MMKRLRKGPFFVYRGEKKSGGKGESRDILFRVNPCISWYEIKR